MPTTQKRAVKNIPTILVILPLPMNELSPRSLPEPALQAIPRVSLDMRRRSMTVGAPTGGRSDEALSSMAAIDQCHFAARCEWPVPSSLQALPHRDCHSAEVCI